MSERIDASPTIYALTHESDADCARYLALVRTADHDAQQAAEYQALGCKLAMLAVDEHEAERDRARAEDVMAAVRDLGGRCVRNAN